MSQQKKNWWHIAAEVLWIIEYILRLIAKEPMVWMIVVLLSSFWW